MKALVLLLLTLVAAAPAGARVRSVRCCLVIPVPGVPDRATCVQVRARRISPRRACRLIGGRPIGRGTCALGLCDPPP